MLAMASSGFMVARVLKNHPGLIVDPAQATGLTALSNWLWSGLAYQLDHVAWGGCAFWDLIQPSFMFMVGVALPFSAARRQAEGQSAARRWGHVLLRSCMLIALGVFLSSNGAQQTRFTYVNVLTQIGLGYPLLYLLVNRSNAVRFVVAIGVLIGYAAWFGTYQMPAAEAAQVRQYVTEVKKLPATEFDQYPGWASHWNKHTNPAAAFDRWLLNQTPSEEPLWNGRRFWINAGGYQTLNFVPSFVTMLFGLMTGSLLRGPRSLGAKFRRLLWTGALCLAVGLAVDPTMWPVQIAGADWNYCPIVKRIWTPSWAVFSTGWTLWMLAGFFGVIEIWGWKKWAFPFVVVGMNSIAMYCFAQLLTGWIRATWKTHLTTLDQMLGTFSVPWLYDSWVGPILLQCLVLATMWLFCYVMYRQKIFIRL